MDSTMREQLNVLLSGDSTLSAESALVSLTAELEVGADNDWSKVTVILDEFDAYLVREQKEDEKDTAAAIEVLRIRIKEWKAEHVLREKDLALLTRNFKENQALRKQELAMIETLTGIIKQLIAVEDVHGATPAAEAEPTFDLSKPVGEILNDISEAVGRSSTGATKLLSLLKTLEERIAEEEKADARNYAIAKRKLEAQMAELRRRIAEAEQSIADLTAALQERTRQRAEDRALLVTIQSTIAGGAAERAAEAAREAAAQAATAAARKAMQARHAEAVKQAGIEAQKEADAFRAAKHAENAKANAAADVARQAAAAEKAEGAVKEFTEKREAEGQAFSGKGHSGGVPAN